MTREFDNNLIGVSKRYAKALIDVAQEKGQLDNVSADLKDFNEMYVTSSDLKNVLNLPTIKIEEKNAVLNEILKSFNCNIAKDFLCLLVEEARFNTFSTVYYCFEQELNLKKGIIEVEVKSVIELDEEIKNKLKEKLEQKFSKMVNLNYVIAPEIIGGLVISYNGKIIDLSVNTKFENLKKELK